MFKKAFKIKTNSNVRNSEKRKLFARFSIDSEVLLKGTLTVAKLLTSGGSQLNVYYSDKEPILFEFVKEKGLFPTVYLIWMFPKCVPMLFIRPDVFDFLENGADLMLPGVTCPPGHSLPEFEKDVPLSIAIYHCVTQTYSHVAVGTSIMSSAEMIACGMKGKGVKILHIYLDTLWESGSKAENKHFSLIESNEDEPAGAQPVSESV